MNIPSGIGSTVQALGLATPASATESAASSAAQAISTSNETTTQSGEAFLSSTAEVLRQALAEPEQASPKVEALRQAISAGTYRTPAEAVADKIVTSMQGDAYDTH